MKDRENDGVKAILGEKMAQHLGPTNPILQAKQIIDVYKICIFLFPKFVHIFFSPGLLTILKSLLHDPNHILGSALFIK